MSLYGLIGYPLGHSFSKKYFAEKFEKEGLDDSYELFPVKSVYEISEIIQKFSNLRGLNVTIPYKQLILKYLDDTTNIPDGLSACNCIKIIDGKTYGYNTDITGFEQSILPRLKNQRNKAMILGNGGAAEAVKYVLKMNSITYTIVSRSIHDGSSLTYNELDENIISNHTIIVNTTPLGMFPDIDTCPDIPYNGIGKKHLLYDLVYNPEKTLFLQKGEACGADIQNGYEMLRIQAEESWRIWNGKS